MFDIYYIALKNLYRRQKNRLESVNQPISCWAFYHNKYFLVWSCRARPLK